MIEASSVEAHGRQRRADRSSACTLAAVLVAIACSEPVDRSGVVTFPSSAVGAEAAVLDRQLERFERLHPGIRVERQATPDSADQRHQLYVQWLNARADDPDVLQLDVVWTPEFAAAGWILPLDALGADTSDLFPVTREANRWRGKLYAYPWFVDVGMLYWRSDVLDAAPDSLAALASAAATRPGDVPYGFVWQGARYEGLITVFLEILTGFGGCWLDEQGRVAIDSEAGVRALTYLRDAVQPGGISPRSVLAWQEEQTRFAFQGGRALLMRNWPYAAPLLADASDSRVAGRFAVSVVPGLHPGGGAATLGGQQLAINAHSDAPDAAWALIRYLTEPPQMLERAAFAGQYPPRPSLYRDGSLDGVLPVEARTAQAVIERAVTRPATPVYTQLSELLQVRLHQALSGQLEPRAALEAAAREMEPVLDRVRRALEAASG